MMSQSVVVQWFGLRSLLIGALFPTMKTFIAIFRSKSRKLENFCNFAGSGVIERVPNLLITLVTFFGLGLMKII